MMFMNIAMGIHNHVHQSKIRTSKMLFFLIVICILLTVAVLVFKTWRQIQIEPTRERERDRGCKLSKVSRTETPAKLD